MSTSGVTIVTSKDEKKKFLEFLYSHYKNDPHFVPPLRMDQKKLLNKEVNPYYKNAETVFFIAEYEGVIAGRISATVDHRYNKEHNSKTGHLDSLNVSITAQTAKLLFKVAEDWPER